jgi:hypothetical protein
MGFFRKEKSPYSSSTENQLRSEKDQASHNGFPHEFMKKANSYYTCKDLKSASLEVECETRDLLRVYFLEKGE